MEEGGGKKRKKGEEGRKPDHIYYQKKWLSTVGTFHLHPKNFTFAFVNNVQ